ncbi:MAG: GNAT family N-acetyltransferase [Bacteroidales bacterium]|nr:GNAT family N-acetyltransferase [Bacteroidales bacterium]
MQYDIVKHTDLEEIGDLQPDGWPDIINEFGFYITYDFCNPIKATVDNRIVGVGTSIMFENTGWLAHIIVDSNFRNKGIGFQIMERLLNDLKEKSIDSVLLIATEIGEPVYKKAGFKVISDYIYLRKEQPWNETSISKNIVPYKEEFYTEIMKLDKKISGENRESLIKKYLDSSLMFIDNNELNGFYLPNLGEGIIFADNSVAGIELMKKKYSKVDTAVIPSENLLGIDFLKQNGFIESETRGKRMILGEDICWKPNNYFSRIGGNYG